jgi:hypothetical protein
MKDQIAAQVEFALRSKTLSPDLALAETAGNRANDNTRITAISIKLKESGSAEMEYAEFRMIIESFDGKFEFMIGEDDHFLNLLKTVSSDRVYMPFGSFKAGGVRIKFF